MKLMLKQTLVAIALASAFGVAQAASIPVATLPYNLGADPTDENTYRVTHAKGSFADDFTFTLSAQSDTISSAVALFGAGFKKGPPSYNITGGTLSLFTSGNVLLGTTTFGNTSNSLEVDNVAAGSYYFKLTGLASGTKGGIYDFSVNTQTVPVPEPETYALMLAGLGVIGFIGRRRLNKSASLNFA